MKKPGAFDTADSRAANRPARGGGGRRAGLSAIEVIVVLVIIVLTALLLMMAMPRGREEARAVACRKHLGQIGLALALYDSTQQNLPGVGPLEGLVAPGGPSPPGPLRILLETLQLPDLTALDNPKKTPPQARPGQVLHAVPVPGFVCASDPNALAGRFTAPISYRAVTGDDQRGDNGAFAPGRVLALRDIEAADGTSYTAAFSERLVGDNQPNHAAPFNYQVVPGPLSAAACPETSDFSAWRGDAGSSWTSSDYRYTLYNHSLPPNGLPSCVAQDGKAAFMGASSGHVRGVNLLLLDGSVTLVRPSVNLIVWRAYAKLAPETAKTIDGPLIARD
jgi:hypothetical protein